MIPTVRDFRRGKGKGRNDGTPGNQSSKLGYQTWTIQHDAEVGMEARRPDPKGSFAGRLPYARSGTVSYVGPASVYHANPPCR